MFDVGDSLRSAFEAGRTRLHDAQRTVAEAEVRGGGGRGAEAALAHTAQAAIFSEALIGAERARFEELKGVAR